MGIDRYDPPHTQGSHGGNSRIYRKSYYEHENYVPLLEKAYNGWDTLEKTTNHQLRFRSGLLYTGQANDEIIMGIKSSSKKHAIELQEVDMPNDFPFFKKEENQEAWFEPDAGYVLPEKTIETYLKLAEDNGARILKSTPVTQIEQTNDGFVYVEIENNQWIKAQKVIVTAGAYIQLLKLPLLELVVTKQSIFWFKAQFSRPEIDLQKYPCWMFSHPKGNGPFYGFPPICTQHSGNELWFKMAHHHPASVPADVLKNPLESQAGFNADISEYKETILSYFNEVQLTPVYTQHCYYTNSNDGHFIIDFLPDSNRQIVVATGFSGHGFKFVPALGEVLSDMAMGKDKSQDLEFLKIER